MISFQHGWLGHDLVDILQHDNWRLAVMEGLVASLGGLYNLQANEVHALGREMRSIVGSGVG
jgi:hypothetical protein